MMLEEQLKRSIAILIIAVLAIACSFVAMPAFAEDGDIIYHETELKAAEELREHMRQRETKVTIGIKGSTDQDGLKKIIGRLVDEAAAHTGEPDEGDYLVFQYASYKGYASANLGASPTVKIEYDISYYDDAEKAEETDRKVQEILDSLDLEDKTEYQKIKAIYNYICDNVEYEASEESGDIRRTAYGALVEGKAVCQGYSVSLYRLLLEAGIDNRIILGEGIAPSGIKAAHTWNIVELYDKYYYLDATWDDSSGGRKYFLRPAGDEFEVSHIADESFRTGPFAERYPMAEEEFRVESDSLLGKAAALAKMISDGLRRIVTKGKGPGDL